MSKIDELDLDDMGDPFANLAPPRRTVARQIPPEVIAARSKSYTNAAVIVLVLYFLLWLPALIANIMYLNEAKQAEALASHKLPGVGALRVEQAILEMLPLILIVGIIAGDIGDSAIHPPITNPPPSPVKRLLTVALLIESNR